jgi:hypothetical protein
MRRREFVRGAAAMGGGAVVAGTVATEAFARERTAATQAVDAGVPQPRSVVTVRTTDPVDAVDAGRIEVIVPIVDPLAGGTTMRTLDVVDATALDSRLRLVVDGPVSQGAVVSFGRGSLVIDGRRSRSSSHTLSGPLDRPERATQWFKAYEPTNVDRFTRRIYPGGAAYERYRAPAGTTVRDRLATHLDRFVDRGDLTAAERDTTLARFDDPAVRDRFVAADGSFDAKALAGVLANAGTVARDVDAVIIDGDNLFGRPYTVRRGRPPSGGLMEVWVDDGGPVIVVHPGFDREPFVALAPLFAHEGFHQDLAVGLHEEVIATYLETLVWAEHLLADPSLARTGTRTVRRANTMLLLALNSGGRSFPDLGLRAAPHRQPVANTTPGAATPTVDFVGEVESRYRLTAAGPSPGVPYARRVVSRVTGTTPPHVGFDDETIDLLDGRTQLFSPDDVLALLATLELRPATGPEEATVPGVTPVPVTDASDEWGTPPPEHSGVAVGADRVDHCGTCLRTAADPD